MSKLNGKISIDFGGVFSECEQQLLKEKLFEHDIEFKYYNDQTIKNSIFPGVQIYLELLIEQFAISATYDIVKEILLYFIKKVKASGLKLVQSGEIKDTNIVIKIPIDNGTIIASLENNITEEKLEQYMQKFLKISKSLNTSSNGKKQDFIIINKDDQSLEIITLPEYVKRTLEKS